MAERRGVEYEQLGADYLEKRYQDLEPGNLYNVDYSMPTSPTTSTTPTSSCARSRRR
jgi:hypothetical protein